MNYSRDSLNLILKPAWDLLNQHLELFYKYLANQGQVSPPSGLRAMTFSLVELLTTLI